MSAFRDANSPGCWANYDKELEKERELLRKIQAKKLSIENQNLK